MSIKDLVKERDEQLDLLVSVVRSSTLESSPSILLYGSPSTGKSYVTKTYLDYAHLSNIWIQCDECVSIKVVLKRILRAAQSLATEDLGDDFVVNKSDVTTFDNFLSTLSEVFNVGQIKGHHYIVLDRADELIDDGSDIFRKFTRLFEVSRIPNVSVIFITSTQPREIITSAIPTIFFDAYDNEQVSRILGRTPSCQFSKNLTLSSNEAQRFWQNYVNIVVESFFPYTTNLITLRRISIKLWDRFTEKIESGELKTNQFLALYRQNIGLLSSDYAFETDLKEGDLDVQEEEETHASNKESGFTTITKYIIIAGYLASFNDLKYDWVFFSKLKGFHKKKQHFRNSRVMEKLNSRLLEPSPFELERLLAITHAIYIMENAKPLASNIDLTTQIANLSTLKILLKSNNNDFINAKTRWKINVNFPYVKSIADELNFPLENYLAE